jgi:formylglycine-generating enzyme required for sulfatase activity
MKSDLKNTGVVSQEILNELADAIAHFETYLAQNKKQEHKPTPMMWEWKVVAESSPEHKEEDLLWTIERVYLKLRWFGAPWQTMRPKTWESGVVGEPSAKWVEPDTLGDVDRVYLKLRWFRVTSLLALPALPKPSRLPDLVTFEIVTVNACGEILQRQPGHAREYVEDLGNGVTLDMVSIPGGTFRMGTSERGYPDERPQHAVTIAPFWMGKFPVTQQQWASVMGTKPSYFKGSQLPVERVSWDEAKEFCQRLADKTGHTYRLPSEAEWEYACRAGTTTSFHFGETLLPLCANYQAGFRYASELVGRDRSKTTPVGSFPPNAFGLYDLHGNVWEWCADLWHKNYKGAPADGRAWEEGGKTAERVIRGGSWRLYPRFCRSANRDRRDPAARSYDLGVRIVMVLPQNL